MRRDTTSPGVVRAVVATADVGIAGTAAAEEEGSAAPGAGEAVGETVTRLAAWPKGWALVPRRARRVTAGMVDEGSAAVDG